MEAEIHKHDTDALDQWIDLHEEALLADLASLVEIASVAEAAEQAGTAAPFGEGSRQALEQMEQIGAGYGLDTDDVDGYCLSLSAGEGSLEIGIWNHLDVVPPGDGWIYPPYQCTRKNGYVIGRGVQDNKGPAVAVLYAVRYCREHGLLRNIRVRQILGCQEESGMQDVAYYLANRRAPDYSFVADCGFPVCCGEKGNCHVTLETVEALQGICRLQGGTVRNSVPSSAEAILQEASADRGEIRVTADGIGGHAAFPDGTVNAIHVLCEKLKTHPLPDTTVRALDFLNALAADGYGETAGIACADEVSGRLTCNAGVVSLEQDRLRLELDIRYPVTLHPEDFLPKLVQKAEQAGFVITAAVDSAPYYMEKTHPFVQLLMSVWRETTGRSGEPFVMGGGTYARKIPNAVAFGPGQERDFAVPELPEGHGNCHCADEAERIDNLKSAVRIYASALIELDRRAQQLRILADGGCKAK